MKDCLLCGESYILGIFLTRHLRKVHGLAI